MILRSLAALSFSVGSVALVVFLSLIGMVPGQPRAVRHLRDMKNRDTAPATVSPLTLEDVLALPHRRPVGEYAALERRGVVMEGCVQRMLLAADGDLHLEIAPAAPRSRADTVYVTGEITPGWRLNSATWTTPALLGTFRPNHGGVTPWDSGPRRVRLSGWLLYDWQYDDPPSTWSLQYGAPRASGWEIHPVTRIEVWDDTALAWREVKP